MIIYSNNDIIYCFIHIPKNCGTYYRNEINSNNQNKIIKNYWGHIRKLDRAHIPYMLKWKYVENRWQNLKNIKYYTYTRNPYDRLISAYFYINPDKKISDFQNFICNELIYFNFDTNFNKNIIHFYPQYLFLCDSNFKIDNDIDIEKN